MPPRALSLWTTLLALLLVAPVYAQRKRAAPARPAAAAPAVTAPAPASATAPPPEAAPVEPEATNVKIERGAGGKKVYRIEKAIVIEGKIQKPEAFYVLQKSSINYEWQNLKQDFLPKILDSVSKSPF